MSNNTITIEQGTVYVSCLEEAGEVGEFDPSVPRFIYDPATDTEKPWAIVNPDPLLELLFGGMLPMRFRHEGDLGDRVKEGSVRLLTPEEVEIAAEYDAKKAG